LARRLREYFNLNYLERTTSIPICSALLKYGYSNFSLEILEYCDSSELLKKEKDYFDLLLPEYNISKDPVSPFLGRKHSDETLISMSVAKLGKQHSEETKAKISAFQASSAHPSCIKIEVLDVISNIATICDSARDAARALSINVSSISNYFKRNQIKPYKGRYVFKKLN
jgi:NUMOD3 motif